MTRGIRLVFARRLRFTAVPPRGQVATLALVNMQPGCQLAKPAATQRWHHRRPWWLAANANTKMFLVFSFSLSFFLPTTWWSFVCGRQLLLLILPSSPSSLPTFLFLTWLNYFLNSSCHFVNCCGHFLPSLEYFPNRFTSASPSSSTFWAGK